MAYTWMPEAIYGWLVTVERPGGAASEVYNVAIRENGLPLPLSNVSCVTPRRLSSNQIQTH